MSDSCLVGVYYFAGWWPKQPNKYTVQGREWLRDFPEREPLLGLYNGQATMNREIVAASSYGVDFFQILWYWQGVQPEGEGTKHLNDGIRTFMASPDKGRMRFTLEYVNHPPFGIAENDAWEEACREWVGVMKDRRYLRLGARPVFKINGLDAFLRQCGGDNARVHERLARLRQICVKEGAGDPLVSGGVMAGGVPPEEALRPYDFVTTYMDVPALPQREKLYPYSMLLTMAEKAWRLYAAKCPKPYVPYVPSGWDPRPWKDPRASFEMPSPREWEWALRNVKAALEALPNLGAPLPDGKRQKMLLIYAWNEFAEGGIVAPTRGEGYTKLEAIREVFARA